METRVCESCGLEWYGASLPDWDCPKCGGALVLTEAEGEQTDEPATA